MDIHKYIDQNSEQMVKELVQLLRIPSVEGTPEEGAPFGKEVRSALDYTLSLCQRLGLKAVNVDGYAGYAEIEGVSGQEIGVLTHLDVVPAKDLGPLTHNSTCCNNEYRWLDDPWPWEYAANRGV